MIERELHLPRCCADNPARRAAAGVPEEIEFATKSALAQAIVLASRIVVSAVLVR
jgi:hypothetical protein